MRLTTLVISSVLLFAVGCGGGDSKTTPAAKKTPAPAKTGAVKTRPIPTGAPYVGEWHAKATKRQLDKAGADARYAGTFRLALRPNGTYSDYQELDGEAHGHYEPVGVDRLRFLDDSGCDAGGFSGRGVYAWKVRGGALQLRYVQGETGGCTGRTETLVTPRWQRR